MGSPASPSPPVSGAIQVVSAARVAKAYDDMAGWVQSFVDEADCVLLGVMLGGMVPLLEVTRRLHGDFLLDYCHVTRYRGDTQGGQPEWRQPPGSDLKGKTVVIVDDIFDEGITLDYVVSACRELGAHRVKSVFLVRKRHDRVVTSVRPDFVGLEVDDQYVFGCGMDYRNRWRHLQEIYALTGGTVESP